MVLYQLYLVELHSLAFFGILELLLLLFTYGEEDEPEPEQDVELLVDNVEGQDAQRVKLLHGSGRTELVELALGHLNNRTVFLVV